MIKKNKHRMFKITTHQVKQNKIKNVYESIKGKFKQNITKVYIY